MGCRRQVWTLAVVLTACGGDDGDGGAEGSGSSSSTTPSTTTTTTTSTSTSTSTSTTSTSGSTSGGEGYWEPRAPMVTARSETAAAVIDGLIYVPGGYGGRSVLEIYDPQADAWSTAASLPEGRDHAAVTALDGILYVIGGNEGETSLFAYDPVNDVWERRRRMPHQRTAAVALAHDGAVWVVGGTSDIVDDPTLREVLRYDPGTDAWTTEGSLSSNRHHHGSVVVDSAFWLFGGRHGLVSDTSTEIYDVVSGTSSVGETMAVGRGGFQSVIHRGLILAHGGDQLDDVPTLVATAEALDPTGGGWTETLELPVAVHGHAAAAVDDVLFIIGGSDFAGGVDNAGRVWALP